MADTEDSIQSLAEKKPKQENGSVDHIELNFKMTKIPSTSRFQVARVDFAEEKPENQENQNDINESEQENISTSERSDVNNSRSYDSPTFYAGSISPTDTYGYNHSYPYETNVKTFGKNTTEALPHVDHYRNLLSATNALKSRPTLAELHEEKDEVETKAKQRDPLLASEENVCEEGKIKETKLSPKFGWIKGVLIRCLLNIWGVMLFLRLSWVVGQSGILFATLIILLSTVVTILTTMSMSAICTNGLVKGGGAYYMISRSLGPEFGGAIGLIFSVANAVAVAMYVVGFAETVRDLLKANNALMIDEVNDIRIIGVITVTLLLCIAIIGLEWEARAQIVLLVSLLIAIANFVIGTFIPPNEDKISKGVVGYRLDVINENLHPKYTGNENFFSVFSIFFPAATGILAGANISGDLKNAHKDIPKGTLLAILLSTIVYILVAWLLGGCILREATGLLPVIISNTTSLNNPQTSLILNITNRFDLAKNCSLLVMDRASGFGPLVIVGIFSATLSSALASLVSAPKVFQAVCKDKIFPKIHVFATGYGASDNPRRAYLLAYFIGIGFICIGDLNNIAPIISNFFLMSYALINYSFYNMWLSLLGAVLCVVVIPSILVLTGLPKTRPALVDFVYTLTRKISLMTCGHIMIGSQSDNLREMSKYRSGEVYRWLQKRKVKSFYNVCTASTFRLGVQSLMQNVGLGKLKPNILMMGFIDAFDLQFGVGILRVTEGFYNVSEQDESLEVQHKPEVDDDEELGGKSAPPTPTMLRRASNSSGSPHHTEASTPLEVGNKSMMSPSTERLCNRFAKKQKKGTIDVWWLFDDGGLTLLLPYILTTKSYWSNCHLRVFAAGTKRGEIDREQRQMATLLSKFRIECSEMIILPDIGKSPKEESMKDFDKLLEGLMLDEEKGETKEDHPLKITEEEKELLKDKTKRNVRLKELLNEHSKDASLIVMTLPMPRKGTCPAALYMAWLDTLTYDMPPILLLRGNQSSVLTFYS
ncbi:hypothetical protein KUTeg_017505 [Tegillarca granosa]|uniref:Uncharacterized protein n=1 Tax=Tegillarca granosa TaxID=220873 RepID=A0ABQ9EF44_TEGGR|nr:hypothetical protein KUTeg_017505 [Tegillarca granosa]